MSSKSVALKTFEREPPCKVLIAHRSSLIALEQFSDREIHPALTCRTYAAGEGNRADDRVGDYAQIEGATNHNRPGIIGARSEGRPRFVPAAPVDFLSHQLRHAIEFAAKTERSVSIVIPQKFVGKVRAEVKRSSKGENLKWAGGSTKTG